MLGPIIGITTSIATIAATGLARGGAAALTGGGRQAPVRRVVIRKNADRAIERLGEELMRERALRMQLEAENARLSEMVLVADEVIAELMQPAA